MSPPPLGHRGAAERRPPAPAARRGRAAPQPSAPLPAPAAARSLAHSPAPGERSHRRLLPSLPPSCQVEPGLPPPDPSFAIGSGRRRNRPGRPSAAPGTAPLSPGSYRRRREGSEGAGRRRRLRPVPVSGGIAPPRPEVSAWGGVGGSSPPGRPERRRGRWAGLSVRRAWRAAAFCSSGKHGATWASRQEGEAAPGEPGGTAPLCMEGAAGGSAAWGGRARRRPAGRAPAVGLRSPAASGGSGRRPGEPAGEASPGSGGRCVKRSQRRSPQGQAASVGSRSLGARSKI